MARSCPTFHPTQIGGFHGTPWAAAGSRIAMAPVLRWPLAAASFGHQAARERTLIQLLRIVKIRSELFMAVGAAPETGLSFSYGLAAGVWPCAIVEFTGQNNKRDRRLLGSRAIEPGQASAQIHAEIRAAIDDRKDGDAAGQALTQ